MNAGRELDGERSVRWMLLLLIAGLGAFLGRNLYVRLSGDGLLSPSAQPRTVVPAGNLADDERRTIELFERVSPCVVYITTVERRFTRMLQSVEVPAGTGSGFIWDLAADGAYVVTNHHVVASESGKPQDCFVTLRDHTTWPARLVGTDPDHDLAVLKIRAPADKLARIEVGTSKELRVGQKTFVIGNPFGREYTLTSGLVSALNRTLPTSTNRTIYGVIQTDAAINPGNSGGPLLNSSGALVGVVTAIDPQGQNLGFAIPVDTVQSIVVDLIRNGRVTKPGLGVSLFEDRIGREVTHLLGMRGGVVIQGVMTGSAAERAGLRPPRQLNNQAIEVDVIVAVAGKEVSTQEQLLDALEQHRIGDVVPIQVNRDGKLLTIPVKLQERSFEG